MCSTVCAYIIVMYMFFHVVTYPLANVHYVVFLSEWSRVARDLDPKVY